LFKTVIPIPNFQSGGVNTLSDGVKTISKGVNTQNGGVTSISGELIAAQLSPLKLRRDLKESLIALLQAIAKAEGLKSHEYATHLKRSLSSTESHLKRLKDLELIVFKGAPKSGGYYLSETLKKDGKIWA
jgi:ATP-dependent DNA helicase RecG